MRNAISVLLRGSVLQQKADPADFGGRFLARIGDRAAHRHSENHRQGNRKLRHVISFEFGPLFGH
jgi:hypothetical protein